MRSLLCLIREPETPETLPMSCCVIGGRVSRSTGQRSRSPGLGMEHMVGGVAQWLRRRSLAGGLSLIYLLLTCDCTSWVKRPQWVNQPGQLNLPSLRSRKMSSNPWITGYRQFNGRPGWRTAGWS